MIQLKIRTNRLFFLALIFLGALFLLPQSVSAIECNQCTADYCRICDNQWKVVDGAGCNQSRRIANAGDIDIFAPIQDCTEWAEWKTFLPETFIVADPACPAGKWWNPALDWKNDTTNLACTNTPAGSYSGIEDEKHLCALGRYQPSAGQSSCILASPGYYVGTTGATSQSSCSTCRWSAQGASSCYTVSDGQDPGNHCSASNWSCNGSCGKARNSGVCQSGSCGIEYQNCGYGEACSGGSCSSGDCAGGGSTCDGSCQVSVDAWTCNGSGSCNVSTSSSYNCPSGTFCSGGSCISGYYETYTRCAGICMRDTIGKHCGGETFIRSDVCWGTCEGHECGGVYRYCGYGPCYNSDGVWCEDCAFACSIRGLCDYVEYARDCLDPDPAPECIDGDSSYGAWSCVECNMMCRDACFCVGGSWSCDLECTSANCWECSPPPECPPGEFCPT